MRFGPISALPRPQKSLKNAVLSLKIKVFHHFLLPAWDAKKASQNGPKSRPGGLQMARDQEKNDAGSKLKFRSKFQRFGSPKLGPKWCPKSLQNRSWAPWAPIQPPKAARMPPGSHFGAFWDHFWTYFATIVGAILEQVWRQLGAPGIPLETSSPQAF